MRAQFLDEEGSEVGMFAIAEHLPDILVGQGGEGGDFELEEVVLRWVEVYSVDAAGGLETEGENVVAGGGNG